MRARMLLEKEDDMETHQQLNGVTRARRAEPVRFEIGLGHYAFNTFNDETHQEEPGIARLRSLLIAQSGQASINIAVEHTAPAFVRITFNVTSRGLGMSTFSIAGTRQSRHRLPTGATCTIQKIHKNIVCLLFE